MSVIDVELLNNDDAAGETDTGQGDRVHLFFAHTDGTHNDSNGNPVADNVDTINDHFFVTPSLPYPGSGYRSAPNSQPDNTLPCRRLDIRRVRDAHLIFEVRAVYASSEDSSEGPGENPLMEKGKVFTGGTPYQKPMIRDFNGKLLLDPFGRLLNPLPMVDDTRPTFTIVRNQPMDPGFPRPIVWPSSLHPWFNLEDLFRYYDLVNSDPFTPLTQLQGRFDVGTVKLGAITSAPAFFMHKGISPVDGEPVTLRVAYRQVTYPFQVRAEVNETFWQFPGWDHFELDAGVHERPTPSGFRQIMVDNAAITSPVALSVQYDTDAEGNRRQTPGGSIIPLNFEDGEPPTFKRYRPYRRFSMNTLRLGENNE